MSIYSKTDSGAARLDNNLSLVWINIGRFAGNGSTSTKIVTVLDTYQYHELLLTCGPAIINQTDRILASTIIPISNWLSNNIDDSGGAYQALYADYMSGVSRISNTSIKLYASPKAVTTVYIR